jgi:hypothetical protein
MYSELLQRPAKYVHGGQHDLHRAALSHIQTEKLQLIVELDVLTKHFDEQQTVSQP